MTVGLQRDDEADSVVLGPGQQPAAGRQQSFAGTQQPPVGGQHPFAGGQRIGRYRLIQPLGEGGMGVVYLALDPNGRAVAIKVLREHIAHDSEARSRLRREVETLARVQDARVAAVLDADTEGPRPFIVTRYIPGPALDLVVAENGPVRGEALLRLGHGLWEALNAIHRAGVIHRDLKPANVLLLDGDPVVIDFGIANVADDIRLTMTGLVMGTPGYLSPEVVEGAPVTEATDWWGWAATLAFAASGAPPFGRGPMDVVLDRVRRGQADLSGVDQRLVPLLRAALSPIPAGRPQAQEVVRALDRYASGASSTLPIPLAGASPTREYPAGAAQDTDPALPGPPERQERDRQRGGQPEPRAGQVGQVSQVTERARVATMLALMVGVLGVATIWPMAAIALVILWSWCARFADRLVSWLVVRRHNRGRRRSDIPLAVLVSPWQLIVSALATVLTLVIPAVVAVGSTLSIALVSSAVAGGDPHPDRSAPLVAGCFLGLLMMWWGPGGARLQRGSRSLLRAVAPGKGASDFLVAVCVLIGVGLGAWAWVRNGQPEWWPWSPDNFRALSRSFW
jgi:predicted Ser/Thr protein kinase